MVGYGILKGHGTSFRLTLKKEISVENNNHAVQGFVLHTDHIRCSFFLWLPSSQYILHTCTQTPLDNLDAIVISACKHKQQQKMKERSDKVALYITKSHAATENRIDSLSE